MIERILFTAVMALIGVGLYIWYTRRQLAKIANTDPLLQGLKPGVPAIVYFTTPGCIPCKTQQQPALARLKEKLGEAIQIVQIDATEQPDDADRWGVMTAPTTFILGKNWEATAVNHGVADENKLYSQLQTAA